MNAGGAVSIALALPLIASLLLTTWEWVWAGKPTSPLPVPVHLALMLAELGAVLALFLTSSSASLFAAGALYGVLGVGASWLRRRRGEVSCGCWGASSSNISPRLIAADFAVATGAVVAGLATAPSSSFVEGLALLFPSVALVTVVTLLLPEFRYAHGGVRSRADRYRAWARGFPELEVT